MNVQPQTFPLRNALLMCDWRNCSHRAALMQQCALLQCRILGALELLPFTPKQANYDNLTHFLEQVQPGSLGDTASKTRLLAKAQHQLTWVQQHMQQGSELCLKANELSAIIAGG